MVVGCPAALSEEVEASLAGGVGGRVSRFLSKLKHAKFVIFLGLD